MNISDLDLVNVYFPDEQYFKKKHPKNQIYLHHTAGGHNARRTFKYWANNEVEVATCVAISGKGNADEDGKIVQGFSSLFWAYHLGLRSKYFRKFDLKYKPLDKTSIGIELCNWGPLTIKNGKYYNYVDGEVPADQVCKLDKPFKGYEFYHAYTDAQIESVRKLLLYWGEVYNIPLNYNDDIWELNKRALSGESGLFTHNSVRETKTDIYPSPAMIKMLKSL